MKKLLSCVVVLALIVSLLAGCGTPATTPDTSSESAPESVAPSDEATASDSTETAATNADEKHKIGVIFYSKDDSLGQSVYALCNQAAAAMNIEIVWQIGALDNDTQISQAENLISAGCEGIMVIPMADTVSEKLSNMTKGTDVKFSLCFRDLGAEVREAVESNPNYIGTCFEDETGAAEQLVKILADQGRTNIGVGYAPPGNPMLDSRNAGVKSGLENTGSTQVGEYSIPLDGNIDKSVSSVQNLLNSYPTMNGIALVSAAVGIGEALTNLVSQSGKDVKIATFDVFDGMGTGFSNGTLAACAGGMAPDALYSFIMLANAVKGTPLSDKFEVLSQSYIFVTSAEEATIFEENVGNAENFAKIYDADFIKALDKSQTPDVTIDDLKAIQGEYSMDWVKEQLGA